ncbi:helix-turn-helix transcriptional regulator [Micromonospora sp. DSM 115977]|uniref:Helix-turn-helix transcriptional regulator n=1 Tax=Micromonospora reichwaldensis TaxID=3075516 RepID=A0ABU2WQL1_9ACTN|nr:helix-turn-helix transcriptional regulator [Micromonospora sp. DSM 115977]MDT0528177.1 helix-turn-helix transcriptional regulator [Micromonospora sp. DSM 115977]
MTQRDGSIDVGSALRAVRRGADLSQRELARRSGVPKSTVARIEADPGADPKLRTVERLVRAAGGELAVRVPAADQGTTDGGPGAGVALPPVPHEERRDEGGRRYPAHLDIREVRTLKDWPAAWWGHWYVSPAQWPVRVPERTYDLHRGRRDERRVRERARAAVSFRRVTEGVPGGCWRLVAELPGGELVGELRAHERSEDLLLGEDLGDQRELVLDGVLVAPQLRFLGIGRRLLGLLGDELDRAGIATVRAIAEIAGVGGADFLVACGYQVEASRPTALRFDRRPTHGR